MDLNLLALSIGVGLVLSLLFSELFGLAAGGLVVPGYMALHLTDPVDMACTLVAALLTFFFVRLLSTFIIVYGRRRTALMIIVGYVAGILITAGFGLALEGAAEAPGHETLPPPMLDVEVIGFIVPGLIAIWLDRQGVVPTLAALLTTSIAVRLVLILTVPDQLQWFEAGTTPFGLEEGPLP